MFRALGAGEVGDVKDFDDSCFLIVLGKNKNLEEKMPEQRSDLKLRLRRIGFTQRDAADHLGVGVPLLASMLCGHSRMRPDVEHGLEKMLSAYEKAMGLPSVVLRPEDVEVDIGGRK